MSNINIQYHKTNIGELILGSYNQQLCMLDYRYRKRRLSIDNRLQKGLKANFIEQDDAVLSETRVQLDEYLKGARQHFTVPLLLVGSAFQKSVWAALLSIPYGDTSTYLGMAKAINNVKAVRAVANANGANSISIIIPCHRIIGSDGALVGYAGGLSVKAKLLRLESSYDLFSRQEN